MTAPLIITRDETLLDELLRLAAAAGVTPEVAPDPAAALRGWSAAPLVLVGADVAAELARPAPPRRDAACTSSRWGGCRDDVVRGRRSRSAPRTSPSCRAPSRWLVELLTDPATRLRAGAAVGVVGGSRRRRRDDLRLRPRPGGGPVRARPS